MEQDKEAEKAVRAVGAVGAVGAEEAGGDVVPFKILGELNEGDIINIITSESNHFSNQDAFVDSIDHDKIHLTLLKEGQLDGFSTEEGDGGNELNIVINLEHKNDQIMVAKNSYDIIYLQIVDDGFDDLYHDEELGVDFDEFNIVEEQLTTETVHKKDFWEQQYTLSEQKDDLFNYLMRSVQIEDRPYHENRINKIVEIYFDSLENSVDSNGFFKKHTNQNKYYKQYINHRYNLEWLLPIIKDEIKQYPSEIFLQIFEQLRHKLYSAIRTENVLYNKRDHLSSGTVSEYSGDSEYENILYNGSVKSFEELGLKDIHIYTRPEREKVKIIINESHLDSLYRIHKNIFTPDMKDSAIQIKATSDTMAVRSVDHTEYLTRKLEGPVYYNNDIFTTEKKPRGSSSSNSYASMKPYLDPIYHAGQNVYKEKNGKRFPVDWHPLIRPPVQKLWIDPETVSLTGWFVDVNKLNMITPNSIYKEYMGTQDDLVFSHSNYQKGYNISDLLRQDLNYNLKFNHSDKLDVTCSTIFDNINIPQTHYLNAKYTFDNLSELRKEIVQFIHDRQKKHSSNKDSSKDSTVDSRQVLLKLNELLLSKILVSSDKYKLNNENLEVLSLNDFNRELIKNGLDINSFTYNDLKRINLWEIIKRGIQKHRDLRKLSKNYFEISSFNLQFFDSFNKDIFKYILNDSIHYYENYTHSVYSYDTLYNIYFKKLFTYITDYFKGKTLGVLHLYIKKYKIGDSIINALSQDKQFLLRFLQKHGSVLNNILKQNGFEGLGLEYIERIDTIGYKNGNKNRNINNINYNNDLMIYYTKKNVDGTSSNNQIPFNEIEKYVHFLCLSNNFKVLYHLITEYHTYNCNFKYISSISVQLYRLAFIHNYEAKDTKAKDTDKKIFDEEFKDYLVKLFSYLNIKPFDKLNIYNIKELYEYIRTSILKKPSVIYSKVNKHVIDSYEIFETLQQYYICNKDINFLTYELNKIVIDKYNKIYKTDVESIENVSNVPALLEASENDLDLLAKRITYQTRALEHYLKTLEFCHTNNINVNIVKKYNSMEDLLKDNNNEQVEYDEAFETRFRDFQLLDNIIQEFMPLEKGGGGSHILSTEKLKEILELREVQDVIESIYYYDLDKEKYRKIKNDFITYYLGKEKRSDDGKKSEASQFSDRSDESRCELDEFSDEFKSFVMPGDHCIVKGGPCMIYTRDENHTWVPSNESSASIANVNIKESILGKITKIFLFDENDLSIRCEYIIHKGLDVSLEDKIHILNYVHYELKAPLLYMNLTFLFGNIDIHKNQLKLFEMDKDLEKAVIKYKNQIQQILTVYENDESDTKEEELKLKEEELKDTNDIGVGAVPKYLSIVEDIFEGFNIDYDYGLLKLKNLLDQHRLDSQKHAYVDHNGDFLVCEHWKYNIESVKMTKDDRENHLKILLSEYGEKGEDINIYCKYCGETIGRNEHNDMDGFKDGKPVIFRTQVKSDIKKEKDNFIKDTFTRQLNEFTVQFCRNINITLKQEDRKQIIDLVNENLPRIETFENLLDNDVLKTEFLQREKNAKILNLFTPNKDGVSAFELGFEEFRKFWNVKPKILEFVYNQIANHEKTSNTLQKGGAYNDYVIQYGGGEKKEEKRRKKKKTPLERLKEIAREEKRRKKKEKKKREKEEKKDGKREDAYTFEEVTEIKHKGVRDGVYDTMSFDTKEALLQNITPNHVIVKFLYICIGSMNSMSKLYIIYKQREILINLISAIYIVLQTAIPDYKIKSIGKERETRMYFNVSDFYNDEDINTGSDDGKEKNKLIVTLFATLLYQSKQLIVSSHKNISDGSLYSGVAYLKQHEIVGLLTKCINSLKLQPIIQALYTKKHEYRIELGGLMDNMSGTGLEDWDTFRPFYNIQKTLIPVDYGNQNASTYLRDNFHNSVNLLNRINQYITHSKQLVPTSFLFNSVSLLPINVLYSKYSYMNFAALEDTDVNKDLNAELQSGEFKQHILQIIKNIHILDYYLEEQNINAIIYPLQRDNRTLRPSSYLDFEKQLVEYLSEDKKIEYYKNEIKKILLLFDIHVVKNGDDRDDGDDEDDGDGRDDKGIQIDGSGRKREFVAIQSNQLFERFLEEYGIELFPGEYREEDTDTDTDSKMEKYSDESVEGIGTGNGNRKLSIEEEKAEKAEKLVNQWNIPIDLIGKDGCGGESEVDYLTIVIEHLRKIDLLSGKSSFKLYKEINGFLEGEEGRLSIDEYKALSMKMLELINSKNLLSYNHKITDKIPSSSVIHKFVPENIEISKFDFTDLVENLESILKHLDYDMSENPVNYCGNHLSFDVYKEYICLLQTIIKQYDDINNGNNVDEKLRNIDNLWFGMSKRSPNEGENGNWGESFSQKAEKIKYFVLRNIFDYGEQTLINKEYNLDEFGKPILLVFENGVVQEKQIWVQHKEGIYRSKNVSGDNEFLEFLEFDFNYETKYEDYKEQYINIISMNNMGNKDPITIQTIPKYIEFNDKLDNLYKTTEYDSNLNNLLNKQESYLYKENSLYVLKYIQVFIHHLDIIKNRYNIITKVHTVGEDSANIEPEGTWRSRSHGNKWAKFNNVRSDFNTEVDKVYPVTVYWNKYENQKVRKDIENEYYDLYTLFSETDEGTQDEFISFIGDLFKTDVLFHNFNSLLESVNYLQYQIREDMDIFANYRKLFHSKHYYELIKSLFYLVIFKFLKALHIKYHENKEGHKLNLNKKGTDMLELFRKLMERVVFPKINGMYKMDRMSESELQEKLEKMKGNQNEKRKRNFQRKTESERNLHAIKRMTGMGNLFEDYTEALAAEKEIDMLDTDFINTQKDLWGLSTRHTIRWPGEGEEVGENQGQGEEVGENQGQGEGVGENQGQIYDFRNARGNDDESEINWD